MYARRGGNTTESSAVTVLTWQSTDKVYSQADDDTGLCNEAENCGCRARRPRLPMGARYGRRRLSGFGAMKVRDRGNQINVDYDTLSPRMDYFIDFAKTGAQWSGFALMALT